MTKKSQARLARDEQEKARQEKIKQLTEELGEDAGIGGWDTLTQKYEYSAHFLVVLASSAAAIVNEELLPYVDQPTFVTGLIKQISSDIVELSGELQEIHSKHEGKTGDTLTADEYASAQIIFQNYCIWLSKYAALLEPNSLQLSEIITAARFKKSALDLKNNIEKEEAAQLEKEVSENV